jgi:hypothetical protein
MYNLHAQCTLLYINADSFLVHPENEWSGEWTIDHLTSTKLPIPTPAHTCTLQDRKRGDQTLRGGFKRDSFIVYNVREKIKREAQIEENIQKK